MKTDLLYSIAAGLLAGVVLLPVTLPKPATAAEALPAHSPEAREIVRSGQN